jgi:hypothetical protein
MKLNSIILFLLVSAISLNAQKQSQAKCSFDLSKILVEQQATESKTIDDTGKRIKILTLAADFFWKSDEATSRKYLTEAFDFAELRHREKGFEKKNLTSGFTTTAEDFRFSIIKTIGKYDSVWAKKLTEKVLKDFEDEDKKDRDEFDKAKEVNEALSYAMSVYDQNPQFALSLFRKVYKYPFTKSWSWILIQLSSKNQRDSDSIYAEVLTNYSNAPIEDLFAISDYPFGTGTVRGLGTSWSNGIPKNFIPNPELQERFLNLILQRAIQFQPNSNETPKNSWREPEVTHLFHALKTLESVVIQKFPTMANEWAAAKTQIAAYLSEKSLKRLTSDEEWKTEIQTSFEKQLESLEKADGAGKLNDEEIFQLVQKARTEEHYSKTENWVDKIQDSKYRESVFLFFFFQRSNVAIKEKRLDDARKFASKIAKIEFRAVQLLKIAEEKIKEKLGNNESTEILFDVYQTAIKADNSVAKAQVFFGLAFVYEKLKHQQALDSLSEGIRTINSLDTNEDVFTNYLTIVIQGKDNTTAMSFDSPGLNLEKVITELSKNDFTNTLNFANSFTDKYYLALSVIAIAKNCKEVAKPAEKVVKSKQ